MTTKLLAVAAVLAAHASAGAQAASPAVRAADKVVKIYGVGGLGRIEAYQTGLLISAEGHVVTANSLVLDQGEVTVVRQNGARHSGQVVGADPIIDVAVVKIDPAGDELPVFDWAGRAVAAPGDRVYALSNCFGIATGDEPVSILRGVVAAIAPLRAERGPTQRIDGGDVYLLDAVTSNPGAAGGALVDDQGRLLGMLGRELRSRATGAWLSYAIPVAELQTPVTRILQGDASAGAVTRRAAPENFPLLAVYGFQTVPSIIARTPPYVDYVRPGSAAEKAGLRADDLIITVDGLITGSAIELRRVLAGRVDQPEVTVVVQREGDFVEFSLAPTRPIDPYAPDED